MYTISIKSHLCLIINLKHVNDILTKYIINKLLNEYCTILLCPNNTDTSLLYIYIYIYVFKMSAKIHTTDENFKIGYC